MYRCSHAIPFAAGSSVTSLSASAFLCRSTISSGFIRSTNRRTRSFACPIPAPLIRRIASTSNRSTNPDRPASRPRPGPRHATTAASRRAASPWWPRTPDRAPATSSASAPPAVSETPEIIATSRSTASSSALLLRRRPHTCANIRARSRWSAACVRCAPRPSRAAQSDASSGVDPAAGSKWASHTVTSRCAGSPCSSGCSTSSAMERYYHNIRTHVRGPARFRLLSTAVLCERARPAPVLKAPRTARDW